jgi:hypothetical protein
MIKIRQNCFKLNEIEASNTGDVTFLTLSNRIWSTLHMFNRMWFPNFQFKILFDARKSDRAKFIFPKMNLASKCSRRSILAANEVSKAEEIGKRPFG